MNSKLLTIKGEKSLDELINGKKLILIYFKEHHTPLCTIQVSAFKKEAPLLNALNINTIIASTDSIKDIANFQNDLGAFPFQIASDFNGSLAKELNIYDINEKKSNRAIFIFNQKCEIIFKNTFYQPANFDQFLEIFTFLENI
ncbi:MAG: redoxin domain-containing protein [Dehalococcoidia bacterium]|jgi:peroxiredoxin|nr:MAG: Peroxiredoxin [Chloroflexota bacterium]|tara:strand:+ start:1477 stop:1905 length:429 start_codon:yes stop_codon:yes gene_type:complete